MKILVATPCYGGKVFDCYLHSLFRLQSHFGNSVDLFTVPNDALVTRARNTCVAKFLDEDFTHLLFIDADIGFTTQNVTRLLDYDKDVVCAAYPIKNIFWEDVLGKGINDVSDAKRFCLRHVVNSVSKEHEDGIVEVADSGTGFMMIKRQVFDQMKEAYPDLKYKSPNYPSDNSYLFFDCMKDGDTYLSEDYTFCKRWRDIGGKIYCDFKIPLVHTGLYSFGEI